jgi:hypothetical protein
MFEQHQIAGEAYAEPLPEGRVGVRVRIPLSGCPSRRWSRNLGARLSNELVGHPAIGHLRLNDIVHGDHLVFEGLEEAEAPLFSAALHRAIEATNASCESEQTAHPNVSQADANAVASKTT